MKMKKSVLRIITAMMMVVMIFGSVTSAFAAVPAKEEVEYKGSGKVEVEFVGKVNWKSPKVTVTDTSGKKYVATIIKKDNDDITFQIKGFKAGTKYNFAISGINKKGTTGYGTVKGTVSIPKAKAAPATTIAKNTAKTTAVNAAIKNYKAQKNTMRDFDIEKDTYKGKKVWEVSFEAKRTGCKGIFEFEFKIDVTTGKILYNKVERD